MNLDKILEFSKPFQHWEISECLDDKTLGEISFAKILEGSRAYDGTRAADHTGKGIDGKLRLYLTNNNCHNFPCLKKLTNKLQSNLIYSKLSKLLKKD